LEGGETGVGHVITRFVPKVLVASTLGSPDRPAWLLVQTDMVRCPVALCVSGIAWMVVLRRGGSMDDDYCLGFVAGENRTQTVLYLLGLLPLILVEDADSIFVIPCSEIAGTKPPYECPGCFIHTYSNNMINRFHVQ
jgi:hypothetical protein